MSVMTMVNYHDPRQLAETLTEIVERIVTVEKIESLTEKQIKFLVMLVIKWKYGQKVDGKEPVDIIKDVLKIQPYLNGAESFKKIKYNN